MCLDIYLSSLPKEEYQKISKYLKPTKRLIPPLLCWDIYYPAYQKMLERASIDADLQMLSKYSKKHSWNIDLAEVLNAYPYEALILTDETKTILWVNSGFIDMTGYSKSQAINRNPSFLQGEKTSEKVKQRIRDKIQLKKPFSEEIINYRKDGTEYNCEVRIFPIIGDNSSYFLALEREVA
jgi:PAS domain S-box-containing protein